MERVLGASVMLQEGMGVLIFHMGSVIPWNVCGVGGEDKKRSLRHVVRKFQIDFLCLLKTKLENIDERTINSIWGRNSRSWYAVPSVGLLCVWNSSNRGPKLSDSSIVGG